MNYVSKGIVVPLVCLFAVLLQGSSRADEASVQVLKPMSGPAAGRHEGPFLLNVKVGSKQAVSYFLSEAGLCRLTVMVADAGNGEDAPNMTTVRFDTAIQAGKSAQFGTAEGKALNFACGVNAEVVTVARYEGGQPPGS